MLLKAITQQQLNGSEAGQKVQYIIGVEITSAIFPERRAQWNYMMQAFNRENLTIQDYKNMKKFSFDINGFGSSKLPIGTFWGEYVDLISSYQKKIAKINTVKSFQKYNLELYINTMFMEEENLTDFLLYLYTENRNSKYYFETIYIKSERALIVIKFQNLEVQRLLLSNDELQKSKSNALEFINNKGVN